MNRNIEIFSISAIDLFASALGAFILVAIILFPYYQESLQIKERLLDKEKEIEDLGRKKEKVEEKNQELNLEIKSVQSKLEETDIELQKLVVDLEEVTALKAEADEEVEKLKVELKKTFLIVSIEWTADNVDVDLHVTDPDSNVFSFGRNNRLGSDYPDSEAQLSFDNTKGPGLELWQTPDAKPGLYCIEYELYAVPAEIDKVSVNGKAFYRNGKKDLPIQILVEQRDRVSIAAIVTEDGLLTLENSGCEIKE